MFRHIKLSVILALVVLSTSVLTFAPVANAAPITYQNFRHRTSLYKYLYSVDSGVYIDGVKPITNDVKDVANWQIISSGSYRLLKNSVTGRCLDSNSSRQVYTNPCSTGNLYQNWQVLPNGSYILLKNRKTGYCLDAGVHYVYTNACSYGNYYMNWY